MDSEWLVYYCDDGNHVVPNNDLVQHILSDDCWCVPFRKDGSIVHNSADDREIYERAAWSQYRRTVNPFN